MQFEKSENELEEFYKTFGFEELNLPTWVALNALQKEEEVYTEAKPILEKILSFKEKKSEELKAQAEEQKKNQEEVIPFLNTSSQFSI